MIFYILILYLNVKIVFCCLLLICICLSMVHCYCCYAHASWIVKSELLNCYTGDRGTAWHAHCWSCNIVFISSYVHSSCPPWSTRLCRSSLGMFHLKLFVHIRVYLLIHMFNLISMQPLTLFYFVNPWQYFLSFQRMTVILIIFYLSENSYCI